MKTYLYTASNLKTLFWPYFHSGSKFVVPAKNCRFLRFNHNNNDNQLLRQVSPSRLKLWVARFQFS